MNDLRSLLLETQSRYQSRKDERTVREKNLAKGGDWRKVDDPSRVRHRLHNLGMEAVISEAMISTDTERGAPTLNVVERIMDESELQSVSFLLRGAAVSKSIGRVLGRTTRTRVNHYGTGFFVSPNLLLTNNHVIWDYSVARNSSVQLNYYRAHDGQLVPPVEYRLLPGTFFITNKQLDFTLVAVSSMDITRKHRRPQVWNPLIRESGKAIVGERVNIIQHPGGEPMQLALRANKIVDVFDSFLHYRTDTQPGSSGAPVYNDQWEVAALHHSGVPKRDSRKRILMTNDEPWNGSRDTMHMIAWIANEGVRISQIVNFIDRRRLSSTRRRLYQQAFDASPMMESVNEHTVDGSSDGSRPPSGPVMEADGSVSYYYRVNFGPMGGATSPLDPPVIPQPGPIPTPPFPLPIDGDLPDIDPVDGDVPPLLDDATDHVDDHAGTGEYYDETTDHAARDDYYGSILKGNISDKTRFNRLSDLLESTHTTHLSYNKARLDHLYPRIDRQESGNLRNIYSGDVLDPVEVVRQELEILAAHEAEILEIMARETLTPEERDEAVDLLEASLPFNCEHVVPQSWFDKAQPMRADLHHLFTCEPGCNSFRSNIPYFDFDPLEEAVRNDCGQRVDDKFEPEFGHGIVARATLYFLLRYPGMMGDDSREMQKSRLAVLKRWHKANPVTRYELHRNAEIFAAQGNRNPLIDFPKLIDDIDFTLGFGS